MKTFTYWHTGKYNISTDTFVGGELACFDPSSPFRVLTAQTLPELRQKWDEASKAQ